MAVEDVLSNIAEGIRVIMAERNMPEGINMSAADEAVFATIAPPLVPQEVADDITENGVRATLPRLYGLAITYDAETTGVF